LTPGALHKPQEEGGKVLLQLCRLVTQRHDNLLARGSRLSQAVGVLVLAHDSELTASAPAVSADIAACLRALRASAGPNGDDLVRSLCKDVGPGLADKLAAVVGGAAGAGAGGEAAARAGSPLATAPIQDVLLRP
jgi:hypothetical protein